MVSADFVGGAEAMAWCKGLEVGEGRTPGEGNGVFSVLVESLKIKVDMFGDRKDIKSKLNKDADHATVASVQQRKE